MRNDDTSDRGPDGLGFAIGIIFGAGFYTGILFALLLLRIFG